MAPQDDNDSSVNNSQDAGVASEAPTAQAAPAFGLLFQAPDPVTRAPSPEPERDQTAPRAERGDDDSADQDGEGGARGRRRGGRGRRPKNGDGTGSDEQDNAGKGDTGNEDAGRDDAGSNGRRDANDKTQKGKSGGKKEATKGGASADQGRSGTGNNGPEDSTDGAKDDDSASDGGRRRTRRRRRSGSGSADGEDPPGTVTKVREPRKERDEVTAIKGSTRLEAKKQRRREGREAGRRRTVITEAEFLARRESVERSMVVREREGRTQIGVLEDGVLVEHYVSRDTQQASMAGNVYLGRVQNVLPSMEAAFVDIGRGRNAVLYAGEVNWDAAGMDGQPKRIENALKSGQTVLVQVTKDPIGHKGARLTSQISLPGRFLVYVPGHSMTGISRKLPDIERSRLKKILKEVVPSEAGVIVRTAAEGASEEDLRADVERLQGAWEKIQADSKSKSGAAPSLLHGEPDLTVRVIRDVFNEDFAKMVISGDRSWDLVSEYVGSVAPDLADRLEKWTGTQDVFTVHRIDEQIAKAMDRKVWLPSGGSLIIDRTEAMTVIDVNTGKFVGSGGNLEETVTKNNIEAAEEIVRQLRLRDIGGIIVVDFIDMVLESNRDLVVRRLLECLGRDRTKHQVAEVTSLGLVQMTRKRVGSGLIEVFSEPCEHCGGRGLIVHDHPVEKQSGGPSSTGSGGSRSRKGKGRKNEDGEQSGAKQPETPKSSDGPTAAQIAAAAHAAALSAGDRDAASPAADGGQTAPVVTGRARRSEAPAAQPESAPEQPRQATTEPATETVAVPDVTAPAVAAPTAAAAKPRKKRKRVVAPAGPPNLVGE
ncbi:Rne/Rng family ribonuclease [Leekyejoonella antrihumi]